MRQEALSAVKAGITRLRDKGGASKESLYDLLNGHVTAARTIRNRGGTRIANQLPAGTVGLVYFREKFWVFADAPLDAGADYEVEVLKHPSDSSATLADIHFAAPFLGYLYVVAEFNSGDVFHYWLELGEPWQPGKTYFPGDLVRPTDPNGLAYRLESDRTGYTVWAPNVGRAVGDVVVPTADNGFKYTVTEVSGSAARSGTSEPEWPTNNGETVYEDANSQAASSAPAAGSGGATVPADVSDRYGSGVSGSTGGNSRQQEP